MRDKYLSIINKVSVYLTLALAFLLPVFFLPITVEFFEFNKLALSAFIALLLVIAWAAKMLIEGKVEIVKAPVNLPILLLVVSFFLSTYSSISRYTSIFGSYGRWNTSLVVMVVCAFLYFAISANINSKEAIRKAVLAFSISAAISSLVTLLSFVEVYILPGTFAQLRTFSLTGSPVATAAIGALGVVILLSEFVAVSKPLARVLIGVGALINFLAVMVIGALPAFVLLIVGSAAVLLMTPFEKIKASKMFLGFLVSVFLVLGIVFMVPSVKSALKLEGAYPLDLKLDLRSSWIITTSSLRDFPLFGSGPSTFFLNFSHYRPLSMNAGDQWNLRFDKAFNEYLDVASTLGIVGFLVYLFLMVKVIRMARHSDSTPTNVALSASLMGLVAFFVLSHSFVVLNVAFFLFLALLIAYLGMRESSGPLVDTVVENASISFAIYGKSTTVSTRTVSVMFALPFLAVAAFAGYFGVRTYAAEVAMRSSIVAANANNASGLFNNQRTAINLNPYIDSYHASFAQTSFILANSLAGSKKAEELSDNEKADIRNLIAASIQEARVTTELLNTTNPAFWEQRGRLYTFLTNVAQDADSWAVGSFTRAIELDPTNPSLRLALGGIYYGAQNYPMAERHFRAAVALKSDYANAHYNLVQSLKAQKRYEEAIAELQLVMRLIPAESEDYTRANEELTAMKNLPEVAGAQTAKPSVSDLQTQPNTSQTAPVTKQEPLTTPEQKQQPTITDVAKDAEQGSQPASQE